MINSRLTNILNRNGGLETLSKMTLSQLKEIKGMTKEALKGIVISSKNPTLMAEYIRETTNVQYSVRAKNLIARGIDGLTFDQLQEVKGMTASALAYIVTTSNNAWLMMQYLIAR